MTNSPFHTTEEAQMLADLREVYEAVPAETAAKWGPEEKYSQGPAVRFLLGLVDKHTEARAYARDIIDGMTLEANEAWQQGFIDRHAKQVEALAFVKMHSCTDLTIQAHEQALNAFEVLAERLNIVLPVR